MLRLLLFCVVSSAIVVLQIEEKLAGQIVDLDQYGQPMAFSYSGLEKDCLQKLLKQHSKEVLVKHLKEVLLSNMEITEKLTKPLCRFSELEVVIVGQGIGPGETDVEIGAYRHLGQLRNLKVIELVPYADGGDKRRSDFSFLTELRELEAVSILDSLTATDLDGLLCNSKLEEIRIFGLIEPRVDQVKRLGELPRLKKLKLGSVDCSLLPALETLGSVNQLKSLSYDSRQMLTTKEIECIAMLGKLEHLELSGVRTEDLTPLLRGCKNLVSLDLQLHDEQTITNIEFIQHLPKLKRISLKSGTGRKPVSLIPLQDHPSLESIEFGNFFVFRRRDLDVLRSIPNLDEITVFNSKISSEEISKQLPKLIFRSVR